MKYLGSPAVRGVLSTSVSYIHTGKDSIISWVTFRKEEVGREVQRWIGRQIAWGERERHFSDWRG